MTDDWFAEDNEPEVEIGPDGLIPPGDCGHLDGTPHSGQVHPIEMMCLHEHWAGDQWCDGHLESAAEMWWPCARCRHDGGRCPTIVRVADTGQQFRFPACSA